MVEKERRNELARLRYRKRKEQHNKELLEALLNDEPPEDVSELIYHLLGSGEYKTMNDTTKRFVMTADPRRNIN
jgi:hypothetical protein